MEQTRTCPECNLIFEAPQPETGLLTCPLCDTVFSARPATAPISSPAPASPGPSPVTSAQHMLKGCLAVGALLVLVGGLVYAYHLADGIEQQPSSPPAATLATLSASESPPVLEIVPVRPFAPQPRPLAPTPKPMRLTSATNPPALTSEPPRPLPLAERVNRAIDLGVAHLRKEYRHHDQYHNYSGLLGLTLLECGVPRDDPTVKQIAAWMRTRASWTSTKPTSWRWPFCSSIA